MRQSRNRSFFSIVGVALLPILCIQGKGAEKLPEPGPAEQKEAEKEARGLFSPPGKDRAEVKLHAKKLLEAGKGSSFRPVLAFVLLKQARDLAAGAGDLETALEASRALGERYKTDYGHTVWLDPRVSR